MLASPLESGPLAFPHVALSRAGACSRSPAGSQFSFPPGRRPMLASLAAMAAGILVYLGRARLLAPVAVRGGRLLNRIVVKRQLAQSHRTHAPHHESRMLEKTMRSFLAMLSAAFPLSASAAPLRANRSRKPSKPSINRASTPASSSSPRIPMTNAPACSPISRTVSMPTSPSSPSPAAKAARTPSAPNRMANSASSAPTELLAAGQYYGVTPIFHPRARHRLRQESRAGHESLGRPRRSKIWSASSAPIARDVVINGWGGVHSGHGHHQASGILTPQAVAAAADPKMYPEQIAEGFTPWKVTLETRLARDGSPPPAPCNCR